MVWRGTKRPDGGLAGRRGLLLRALPQPVSRRDRTGNPRKVFPANQEVADYIRWRANRVTDTIRELADFIHVIKPDAPISANDYDVTMRNSFLIYGLDVEGLSKIQDVIMVENFALPRWDEVPEPRLANNALTIRNTRFLSGTRLI